MSDPIPGEQTESVQHVATDDCQMYHDIFKILAIQSQQLDWLCQSIAQMSQVFAGIQHAASTMNGPLGAIAKRMTGGRNG